MAPVIEVHNLRKAYSGEAWRDVWVNAVVLVVILGLCTALAARLFRWE